jgi:hypothetical protein
MGAHTHMPPMPRDLPCGRNSITGLTTAASPRVDISNTCRLGQKPGVSLPLLTCSPSAWPSRLLYRRGRKSQRYLRITLYYWFYKAMLNLVVLFFRAMRLRTDAFNGFNLNVGFSLNISLIFSELLWCVYPYTWTFRFCSANIWVTGCMVTLKEWWCLSLGADVRSTCE